MLLKNIPNLIDNNLLNINNYCIVDEEISQELIKNGFSFISIKDNHYYFLKSKKIIDYLNKKKGG